MNSSGKISAAIVGVTGYEGAGVARILAHHPNFQITEVVSRSLLGTRLSSALPSLASTDAGKLMIREDAQDAEIVFLAVPHGPAAELASRYRAQGRSVIDISADFRFRNPQEYERWYGRPHPFPELLPQAVYGLPEWFRQEIRETKLTANPGCFPTGAILALAPIWQKQLVENDIIVSSLTGVSGAGRSPTMRAHFVEDAESVTAYAVTGHRHLPEMEGTLQKIAPEYSAPKITFVPHLVPMNRGILTTCYATLQSSATLIDVKNALQQAYATEPFVVLTDAPPETSWARGSNMCFIYCAVQPGSRRLILISAIDNLMKGGAGQAAQNANIMYQLPETAGLEFAGVWP